MSRFGVGALVRTIESDDEVDNFEVNVSGDESDVVVEEKQTKSKKGIDKNRTEKLHVAGRQSFFSEIEQSKADEEVNHVSLSIKNEALRKRISNRAELIKQRALEAEKHAVDEEEIAQQVNKELLKKRNAKYGIESDDDDDSDGDDEFSRPAMDSDEEREEKAQAAKMIAERRSKARAALEQATAAAKAIADDDDEEKWGDDEEEDDDVLEESLNQDVFASQTTVTTSDMSGENALTIVPDNIDFTDLRLSRPVIQAIKQMNFVKPTPIQAAAIPLALAGNDVLANAVTGSGKTAAFLIPAIERLLHQTHRTHLIRTVIITPTRELAEQIYKIAVGLCKYTDLKCCCIVGGLNLQLQEAELRAGPDIVVCTPGRLIDHLANSKSVDLDDVEMLILDEADRLLEMGFIDEVKEIVASCPRSRQTMLFSATLSDNVQELIHLSLKDPKRISVDKTSSIVDTLTQEFVRLRKDSDLVREAIVLALCKRTFKSRTIIFARTKMDAHRLLILFGLCGLNAAELHGNLTQAQRLEALQLFKDHKVDFLICTDLAARGIDIKGVQTVINLHMPRELAQYVHRVGRTARAGNKGRSVSIISEEERRLLRDIMKAARNVVKKREVPPEVITKYSKKVSSLAAEIDAVLQEEKAEKELRLAERDVQKAENLALHSNEIYARPARTWFQSGKEKEEARKNAALVSSQTITELKKLRAELTEQEQEIKAETAKPKDPLQGLSRAKRRRKLMQMEGEKAARETQREIEESDIAKQNGEAGMSEKERAKAKRTVDMLLHPERAVKAVKRQQKREERAAAAAGDEDGAGPTAFIRAVKAKKREYYEELGKKRKHNGEESKPAKRAATSAQRRYMDKNSAEFLTGSAPSSLGRFAEASRKYNDSISRQEAMEKEARKPKGPGAFKSDKRYKRR